MWRTWYKIAPPANPLMLLALASMIVPMPTSAYIELGVGGGWRTDDVEHDGHCEHLKATKHVHQLGDGRLWVDDNLGCQFRQRFAD
jgi:hypothetical protein